MTSEFKNTSLEGVIYINPKVFTDERGYFFESFNQARFKEHGITAEFVQDNESMSKKNALRGLHFQAPPFAQGKLVRVVQGAAMDVVVDIRKASKTYGQHYATILSEKNHSMLWVPPGFAHGFLSLEADTIFCYKCTMPYDKASERGLLAQDPNLGIDWMDAEYTVIERDRLLPALNDLDSPF